MWLLRSIGVSGRGPEPSLLLLLLHNMPHIPLPAYVLTVHRTDPPAVANWPAAPVAQSVDWWNFQ